METMIASVKVSVSFMVNVCLLDFSGHTVFSVNNAGLLAILKLNLVLNYEWRLI